MTAPLWSYYRMLAAQHVKMVYGKHQMRTTFTRAFKLVRSKQNWAY